MCPTFPRIRIPSSSARGRYGFRAAAEGASRTLLRGRFVRSLLVGRQQKGNPVLRHIRNVPWEYAPVLPDYVLGASTCALFLR